MQMQFARDELMSPEEFGREFGVSVRTLGDWRSQKRGPRYLKVGRNIFYPKKYVDRWLKAQTQGERNVVKKTKRKMALQVQTQRSGIRTVHKFGRHRTQSEKRAEDRVQGPRAIDERPPTKSGN